MRQINHLVIHCAATPNGKPLSRNGATAAQVIDEWHFQRGFHRSPQSQPVVHLISKIGRAHV